MKKVKINYVNLPTKESVYTNDLFYKVNLGNGIVKKFTAKAEADKFLNEVSKFLTYKLHECNELYISVFAYYRRAWFYFDHNKHKPSKGRDLADLYSKERECDHHLLSCHNTFNLLYKRANWANGNHFVFVHFNTILTGLLETVKILAFIYENKSIGGIQYELEILSKKITYCKRTIDNYTVELENSFTEAEQAVILKLA
jgi:hypothetical protein